MEVVKDPDATDNKRILSELWYIRGLLSLIYGQLHADFALTHGKASLVPDLKLQWPIAPKDTEK